MKRRSSSHKAFTLVEAMVLAAVLLLVIALAVPGFAFLRRQARQAQNATQLRGILQGMDTYANSSKTGGPQGWYPGIDTRGMTTPIGDAIPAAQLAAVADMPGYAAVASENVLPGEMNGPDGRGFIVRAMAELAAGDFIPAGTASYFVNPTDTVKTPFFAGDPGPAGRFGADKISYTTLDLSKSDGGVFPFKSTWKEDADPAAILLADRAVRDGMDPLIRSSVWTQPGSGDWRGSVALHDGSASFVESPDAALFGRGSFDGLPLAGGSIDNAFAPGLQLLASPTAIASTSGLLYDEADSGTDPDAF